MGTTTTQDEPDERPGGEPRTLVAWIDEGLARHGDRTAVIELEKDEASSWSYEELRRLSGRFARGLVEEGFERGERLAFLAASSSAWITACLGALRSGVVPVPIDVQFDDEALAHVLADSRPRAVLTDARQAARLERLDLESRPDVLLLDGEGEAGERAASAGRDGDAEGESEGESEGGSDERVRSWRDWLPEEPAASIEVDASGEAILFYTSGTTGPPKGVPLSQENIAKQLGILSPAGLLPSDRVLLPLPFHHVYPLVVGLLHPLTLGAAVVLPYSLTGPQLVRALDEAEASVIVGVPRLYRALYDGIRARVDSAGRLAGAAFRAVLALSLRLRRWFGLRLGKRLLRQLHARFGPKLRIVASGGSPLDEELAWKLEALGWETAVGYGLTETSPLLTLDPPGEGRIGTVGRVASGVELRIEPVEEVDGQDDGEDAARASDEGEVGEILVRGPTVFSGYLNLPEKTREVFTDDGWFRTGDLGWLDEDGFLRLRGRKGTMIVTEGGENVRPEDVEAAYAEHPAIREIGVLADDARLVALVVPDRGRTKDEGGETHGAGADDGAEAIVEEAIDAVAAEQPSYRRPNEFRLTRQALPRTHLGKLRRHKLRERFEQAAHDGGDEADAVGPLAIEDMETSDQALLDDPAARRVWDLLAREYGDERRLTPDSSVARDLDVDSLEWLNLSLDIRREAGVELGEEAAGRIETVRDLFEETVEAAAEGDGTVTEEELWRDDPEAVLDAKQRRLLELHGPIASAVAGAGFALNRLALRLAFRLDVEGADRIPDEGPIVLVANHGSYLDAPAIAAALPKERVRAMFWGGWTETMFANPFVRALSRLAHVVPIDPDRGVMSSLAFGAAVLGRGHSLAWFPEGQRSREGRLQPFRAGIGLLLERHPVTVVPAAILGAHEALPPGRRVPRRRTIRVRFGEALDAGDLGRDAGGDSEPRHERIASALRDAVASELDREAPVEAEGPGDGRD